MKKIISTLVLIFVVQLYANAHSNANNSFGLNTIKRERVNNAAPLINLFQHLNSDSLQIQDSIAIAAYLKAFNEQIIDYVKEKYNEDLVEICGTDNQAMIFMGGFIVAINEAYGRNGENGWDAAKIINSGKQNDFIWVTNKQLLLRPQWVSCAAAALGIESVEGLFSGYGSLLSGSVTTGLQVFKNIAKRYLGWIGVGFAIYEFGDCMSWW